MPCPGGLRLFVRVTPRAARAGVRGLHAGPDGHAALKVALTAPPVDGKANAALIALLAKLWRLPKGDFAIVGGSTDRSKTVIITGDSAALAERLRGWLIRWRSRHEPTAGAA